jgi:hypothetical protein
MEHSHNVAGKSELGRTGASPARPRVNGISLHPLLQLQSLIGNRAVQRLRDAQIHAGQNEERAPGKVVNEVLNTPGEPLDAGTRGRMESNFGHDFSGVRVHTGTRAAESAQAVQSHAFTSGQDIVFAEGRFNPDAAEGQRLLAHELTHVVQQSAGPVAGTPTADGSFSISHPDDAFEQAAAVQAEQLAEPGSAALVAQPTAGKAAAAASVQRDHAGGEPGEAAQEQKAQGKRPIAYSVDDALPSAHSGTAGKVTKQISRKPKDDDLPPVPKLTRPYEFVIPGITDEQLTELAEEVKDPELKK